MTLTESHRLSGAGRSPETQVARRQAARRLGHPQCRGMADRNPIPRTVLSPPPPRWKRASSLWAMASCRRPKHKLDDQADAIKRAVDIIKFAGKPPRSWESPGPIETEATLDLLRLNGIEYVADCVIDDLPQDITTPRHHNHHPLFGGDQRHCHPCPTAFAVRAVFEALHRPFRPPLSRRRRQCTGDGDLDPSLHHRRPTSDQLSGGAARPCHLP